jgi:hypothetical protein
MKVARVERAQMGSDSTRKRSPDERVRVEPAGRALKQALLTASRDVAVDEGDVV